MDPETFRQIGDWHPILLPPILFLNTAVLLLSSLAVERARLHIFREIDVLEEWLGLGRPALRRALPWIGLTLDLWPPLPWRPDRGLEAVDSPRLRLRSLGHSGQLFLLRHHRLARCSPGSGHPRVAVLFLRPHPPEAGRIAPDRRGLNCVVLACDDGCLDGLVCGLAPGTVRNLPSLSKAHSEFLLWISFAP